MTTEIKGKIEEANKAAIQRVLASRPFLVDVRPAIQVLPGMKKNSIFHAGPPIDWKRMCGPMKGAIVATLIFEKMANTWEEAEKLVEQGEIELSPNHDHDAVGPMAGVISSSMPVVVVKNEAFGNVNFGRIVENKVQFGAFDKQAIESLEFWSQTVAPAIAKAVEKSKSKSNGGKGIDLKVLMAKALYMGDELHNRPVAGTALFAMTIMPYLIETIDRDQLVRVANYFSSNEIFFLCLAMAACKATMNSAHDTEYSTLVTVMARNGTEFGIKVSGLGNKWFVGPAGIIRGMYFPGHSAQEANPDMGDSAITETTGLGGFALANSPAILSLVGGTAEDAFRYTKQMREITMTLNDTYLIPILDFEGTATGIDIRKVVKTGTLPVIDTAVAHKDPGVGMIGAGIVNPPMECFKSALREFASKYRL